MGVIIFSIDLFYNDLSRNIASHNDIYDAIDQIYIQTYTKEKYFQLYPSIQINQFNATNNPGRKDSDGLQKSNIPIYMTGIAFYNNNEMVAVSTFNYPIKRQGKMLFKVKVGD